MFAIEEDLDKKYKDSSDNLYITNTDIESFNSKLDSTLDKTGLVLCHLR